MAITLLGHPSGTREVAFEGSTRAVGLGVWVDAQHDPRDIMPVGAFRIGIEQMQVRDDMLLVVGGHCWIGGARSATLGSRSGFFMGVLAARVQHVAHNVGHGVGSSRIPFINTETQNALALI